MKQLQRRAFLAGIMFGCAWYHGLVYGNNSVLRLRNPDCKSALQFWRLWWKGQLRAPKPEGTE